MKIRNYLVIASFILFLITSCKNKEKETQTEQQIPVKAVLIALNDIDGQRKYIGSVEESALTQLSFQVAGNVKQILVSEGSKVHAGQLIATLDRARYQKAYEVAKSQKKQAKDAYQRLKIIYDNKSLPEIKIIEAQSLLEQAEAAESLALKDVEDCNLYAPYSGVIGTKGIDLGANVAAGMPVFTVLKVDKIRVKVSIPENDIKELKIGDDANVYVKTSDKSYTGKIVEKGVVANPYSRAYTVKVDILNGSDELLPGMDCNITFKSDNLTGYSLPISVIQISARNERYVWKVSKDNTVSKQTVKIGELTSDGVVVLEGIGEGDRIVTEGFQKIFEGSKVIVN